MFVGRHEHALDDKGRVVLPSGYRSHFDERGYMTWLGDCFGFWTPSGFKEFSDALNLEAGRGSMRAPLFRKILGLVREVRLDTAGRIALPKELLGEYGFDRQVIIAGRLDRIEIWAKERYVRDIDDNVTSEELAEAIASLGI